MYMVHRQAMAMDRGQLVLTRTMVAAFCNKTGIAPVTGGSCSCSGRTSYFMASAAILLGCALCNLVSACIARDPTCGVLGPVPAPRQ